MGHEATCVCHLNGKSVEVKALVEPPELILRGGIKRRLPFAKLRHLATDGPLLSFQCGEEEFTLELGAETAAKWVGILQKPAPTLAAKLGVNSGTKVKTLGIIDDEALRSALSEAHVSSRGNADVIIARAFSRFELETAFERSLNQVLEGASLWIVYRKGKGHPTCENDVRETGLAAGIVDVKICSVSEQLTALKFVRRKLKSVR